MLIKHFLNGIGLLNQNKKETTLKVLKKEMKEKRMTFKDLSEKIGVSRTTINNWISGKCSPSFANMDSLAELGFSNTACLEPSKDVEV